MEPKCPLQLRDGSYPRGFISQETTVRPGNNAPVKGEGLQAPNGGAAQGSPPTRRSRLTACLRTQVVSLLRRHLPAGPAGRPQPPHAHTLWSAAWVTDARELPARRFGKAVQRVRQTRKAGVSRRNGDRVCSRSPSCL